jgi:hypothetical protein
MKEIYKTWNTPENRNFIKGVIKNEIDAYTLSFLSDEQRENAFNIIDWAKTL